MTARKKASAQKRGGIPKEIIRNLENPLRKLEPKEWKAFDRIMEKELGKLKPREQEKLVFIAKGIDSKRSRMQILEGISPLHIGRIERSAEEVSQADRARFEERHGIKWDTAVNIFILSTASPGEMEERYRLRIRAKRLYNLARGEQPRNRSTFSRMQFAIIKLLSKGLESARKKITF